MIGYKNVNKDMTCQGFYFEVGMTYTHAGPVELCARGFHFHKHKKDLFSYYKFDLDNTLVFEVEAGGEIIDDDNKSVCSEITLIRQISKDEILKEMGTNTGWGNSGDRNSGSYNSGDYNSGGRNSGDHNSGDHNSGDHNSGDHNSGNYNSGYCNSGNYNSGYCNSGYRNSGYRNSGNYNSGDHNSGYCNSGNYNSGYCNSGNYNSGYCNSGNYNSGFFNSDRPKHPRMFNSETTARWGCADIVSRIISKNFYDNFNVWVPSENMTEGEKAEHKSHETIGGFLRTCTYKEAWKLLWENITDDEKAEFYRLPNFNWAVFTEITGIEEGKC